MHFNPSGVVDSSSSMCVCGDFPFSFPLETYRTGWSLMDLMVEFLSSAPSPPFWYTQNTRV